MYGILSRSLSARHLFPISGETTSTRVLCKSLQTDFQISQRKITNAFLGFFGLKIQLPPALSFHNWSLWRPRSAAARLSTSTWPLQPSIVSWKFQSSRSLKFQSRYQPKIGRLLASAMHRSVRSLASFGCPWNLKMLCMSYLVPSATSPRDQSPES